MRKYKIHWLILVLAMMFLVSCGDDPKKPDPEPELEPIRMQAKSWEDAIDLFATAWEEKNFALYDSLLTEDFIFYFSPVDVAENPGIPPSWNRSADLFAVESMFADPNLENIGVAWILGDLQDSEAEGMDGRVLVTNIDLVIDVRDDEGVLWNNSFQGAADFELKKMSWTTAEGDTVWKIARWRDFTAVAPISLFGKAERGTWGLIKYKYRR